MNSSGRHLLSSIIANAMMMLPPPRESSFDTRHDPNREKTEEDLARIAKAQEKRNRKLKRK